MKKDLTLVILAAGMGSRFGGLKQITPVGPNKEFIIDYSIYDAIKAGFNKIVFIIKRENLEDFKNTIGKRIEDKIDVTYVFQDMDNLPYNVEFKHDRKPLGTAHAIWCCKDVLNNDFVIINADDFYGYESFEMASAFLNDFHKKDEFCMIGYKIKDTIKNNEMVKRGICKEDNGYLKDLCESKVLLSDNKITAYPLDGTQSFDVLEDSVTSMNMFGFTPYILDLIKEGFMDFYIKNKNDMKTCEYLIPDVVSKYIKNDKCKVKVLKTNEKWYGMTYKEDEEEIKEALREMTRKRLYPSPLWKK